MPLVFLEQVLLTSERLILLASAAQHKDGVVNQEGIWSSSLVLHLVQLDHRVLHLEEVYFLHDVGLVVLLVETSDDDSSIFLGGDDGHKTSWGGETYRKDLPGVLSKVIDLDDVTQKPT